MKYLDGYHLLEQGLEYSENLWWHGRLLGSKDTLGARDMSYWDGKRLFTGFLVIQSLDHFYLQSPVDDLRL
jgi:hypothetical protein